MNHLNLKSLAFYGIAISSVLLLFKVVTAYGESNLKAAQAMSDRYLLTFDQNLPKCKKSNDIMLNIQQSGIYLNGSLLPSKPNNADISKATANKTSLTGILKNQQLNLSGKVPISNLCNITKAQTPAKESGQNNSSNLVTIQIQKIDKGNLSGQLTINGISPSIGFTAVPQKNEQSSDKSTSH